MTYCNNYYYEYFNKFNEIEDKIIQSNESWCLEGPAGTGKSTLAIIVARELFKEYWRENYLELNASDARGIDVIRQEVKNFARTKSLGSVPFKIIFTVF